MFLLAAGAAVVAYAGGPELHFRTLLPAGVALFAAAQMKLPPLRRAVLWILQRLRDPSPRGVRVITISLALLAANYFIFTGLRRGAT